MKKITQIFVLLFFQIIYAQVDYSNSWEDYYSYNNVKDFIKVDDDIYAVVDNALFKYNISTGVIAKISSVNGLSGATTTSIFYSKQFDKIVIGYETGLIEIIDSKGNITIAKDIENFNYSGSKQINNITEFENKLYLSTSFAIVVYNIEKLQFGDTYFIGNQSTEIRINQVQIENNIIYAATENGIFTANVSNPNLIDYNNWTQNFTGDFVSIEVLNSKIYTARTRNLYEMTNNSLVLKKTYSQNILSLKTSSAYLAVATQRIVNVFDTNFNLIVNYTTTSTDEYYYSLNTAYFEEDSLFLGTTEYGILKSYLQNIATFEEIHPEGPTSNSVFSIAVKDKHLWVVYGGYTSTYKPNGTAYGFSHYDGINWIYTKYSEFQMRDLVNVTFDFNNINKVYISSWGGGMFIVEDDIVTTRWTSANSGLEQLTRINGSDFDQEGNLWIANAWTDNRIKKYDTEGNWTKINMNSVMTDPAFGLNELVVDKMNTVFIGSRRNGVLVYNENGNKKRALTTEYSSGDLPDLNVRTLQVDSKNRLWIGTLKGLTVLYNTTSVFDQEVIHTEPIIILDDGTPKRLLGEQPINSIAIDGADNKWFGLETGGVIQTDPNGTKTLNIFNTSNSPLPSKSILKIAVDNSTGKVYFATTKGIVAYNSNVAAYGETLADVYAYPNPSTRNNEFITIDGRNGTHLPKGTNIKILDAAGNLVYETNIESGEELFGGKVVWNKTNLAGKKVASGVYIVLLVANDNSETQVTKIAIIN
jgi:hypothetical protein